MPERVDQAPRRTQPKGAIIMAAGTATKDKANTKDAKAESKKAQQQEKEKAAAKAKAEEAAKAKAEAAEARKAAQAEKAAEKKAEAEKKAKEREEAKAAKEREAGEARQALIDSGALIVDGSTEYHAITREEDLTVETRAASIVNTLKASKTPVAGKDLQDENGGGWPQYLSFFAMLKSLGLVREYRSRTGERGGSGVAYLWIGE
jgi:hypothetical protein